MSACRTEARAEALTSPAGIPGDCPVVLRRRHAPMFSPAAAGCVRGCAPLSATPSVRHRPWARTPAINPKALAMIRGSGGGTSGFKP